jgi:hypothetical protein
VATSVTILSTGDTLGGYCIDGMIGLGGMAIVYRAEQISLGRPVALKVLAPQLNHDEAFRERFRREGRHVAALDHPHILTVYDSGEIDGHLYLAMRLVEGDTLSARMLDGGLSADETLRILTAVAGALDCAHAADVYHRDVKPQNILLTAAGHPYLADFGVAKAGVGHGLGLTATGGFVGSINYAAPEQIRGEGVNAAGDVYALTAVLFQCLTGEVPYPRDTDVSVMHAHLNEPPPSLRGLQPRFAGLDAVLARGMAKDTGERYASAGDLMADARRVLAALDPAQRAAIPAFVRSAPTADAATTASRVETADTVRPPEVAVATVAPPETAAPAAMTAPKGPASEPKPPGPGDSTEIVGPRAGRVARAAGDATAADIRRVRPEPEAESAPPHRGRTRLVLIGVGVTVLAVIAVVIVLISGSGSGGGTKAPAAAITRTLRGGPWRVSYAAPWRAASVTSPASGVLRSGAAAVDRSGETLTAGVLRDSAPLPGGPPPALVHRLGAPSSSSALRLAGHTARRYRFHDLTAYVLPTTGEDVAILCGGSVPATCTPLAATAKVSGIAVLAPGADTALAARVSRPLKSAGRARTALGPLTGSFPHRAAAARRAAHVELTTATTLSHLRGTPPRYRARIDSAAKSLRLESRALSNLASTAAARRRSAYRHAVTSVTSAGRALTVSVSGLRAVRLTTLALHPLKLAGPPAPPAATPAEPTQTSSSTAATTPTYTPPSTADTTPTYTPPSTADTTPTYTPPSTAPATTGNSSGGNQTVTSPFR